VVWYYTYTSCDRQTTVPWTYTYHVVYSGGLTLPPEISSTIHCVSDAVWPGAPDITDACGRTVVATEYTHYPITCTGTISPSNNDQAVINLLIIITHVMVLHISGFIPIIWFLWTSQFHQPQIPEQ